MFFKTELSNEATASCVAVVGSEQCLLGPKTLALAGLLGLRIGRLGERTSVTGYKLTQNMKILTQSGLFGQSKEGRHLICVAIAFYKVQNWSRFLFEYTVSTTLCEEQSDG